MRWGKRMALVALLAGAAVGVGGTVLVVGGDDGGTDKEAGRLAECGELIEALQSSAPGAATTRAVTFSGGPLIERAPRAARVVGPPLREVAPPATVRARRDLSLRFGRGGSEACSERGQELAERIEEAGKELEQARREALEEIHEPDEAAAALAPALGSRQALRRELRHRERR